LNELKKIVNLYLHFNKQTIMYKLFTVLTIISMAFLSSCSKKKQFIYENDADWHEWLNQTTVKKVANAHSGTNVSVIDSTHQFSLGLSKTLSNISDRKLTQVKFSYWVFVTSDVAKASTVISIDFNGKNVIWEGRPVKGAVLNTWTRIEETFAISSSVDLNNTISLYVLNNCKEEILVDDIKYEFK
jgi:hypothetical protein